MCHNYPFDPHYDSWKIIMVEVDLWWRSLRLRKSSSYWSVLKASSLCWQMLTPFPKGHRVTCWPSSNNIFSIIVFLMILIQAMILKVLFLPWIKPQTRRLHPYVDCWTFQCNLCINLRPPLFWLQGFALTAWLCKPQHLLHVHTYISLKGYR